MSSDETKAWVLTTTGTSSSDFEARVREVRSELEKVRSINELIEAALEDAVIIARNGEPEIAMRYIDAFYRAYLEQK
jgi:hypothetical protein